MPLIHCPDCNSEISDKAPSCPNCGRPMFGIPAPQVAAPDAPVSHPQQQVPGGNTQAAPAASVSAKDWTDTTPHPWRRFFARNLDNLVGGAVLGLLDGVASAMRDYPYDPGNIFTSYKSHFIVGGAVFLFFVAILNALLFWWFGTTLGKLVFGVKVLRADGRPMGFGFALVRELKVLFIGSALGIPFVWFITAGLSYYRLKKTGRTMWDDDTLVVHRNTDSNQTLLYILGLLPILFTYIVLIGFKFWNTGYSEEYRLNKNLPKMLSQTIRFDEVKIYHHLIIYKYTLIYESKYSMTQDMIDSDRMTVQEKIINAACKDNSPSFKYIANNDVIESIFLDKYGNELYRTSVSIKDCLE